MDPLFNCYSLMATIATILLPIVCLCICSLRRVKTTRDSYTQTNTKQHKTAGTSTPQKRYKSIANQVPEKRCILKDQGCEACIIPYGATVMEQIREYRKSHTNLEEVIAANHRHLEIQIERFTKDVLEQSIRECTNFQHNREDVVRRLDQITETIKEDIHKIQTETQNNLHKLQESLYYEVQRSTNVVVQQLLTIPPPPPRPWLYLPYSQQTQSQEAHRERKARQDCFWSHQRQVNTVQPAEPVDQSPPESEDAQTLD